MDAHAVTNRDFLGFVRKHAAWRRSEVPRIFADKSYLKHWRSDLSIRDSDRDRPVTNVSWFAASAYCRARGKELPTTDQWEYAAADAGRDSEAVQKRILAWYSSPNPRALMPVRAQHPNGYGVYDLYGLVWEWTLDFNSSIVTKDDNMFCGSGSLKAADASDYAKFMRYSFRSSLQADYTTANLGFRCAREDSS